MSSTTKISPKIGTKKSPTSADPIECDNLLDIVLAL